MKILANDGLATSGVMALKDAGFEVDLTKVAQEQLAMYINENNIDVLLVRSATKVKKDIIDSCPSLKVIGRGGVGMDNIDVEYAKQKGIEVINTPAASSHSVAELVFAHLFGMDNIDVEYAKQKGIEVINTPAASSHSVAELVFAHLFGMVRFLHESNRNMPLEGDSKFKELKKSYGKGVELKGKTFGVIGFGRIGQATAKIALSLGMKVVAYDPFIEKAQLEIEFFDHQTLFFNIETISKEDVLKQSDFISLHVPAQKEYVISEKEFNLMKDGVFIVNAARGGVINEVELIKAIENGKVARAALDVFEKEPTPEIQLLMNPNLSLTPHIGAATDEAQSRIGTELATQIINYFSK